MLHFPIQRDLLWSAVYIISRSHGTSGKRRIQTSEPLWSRPNSRASPLSQFGQRGARQGPQREHPNRPHASYVALTDDDDTAIAAPDVVEETMETPVVTRSSRAMRHSGSHELRMMPKNEDQERRSHSPGRRQPTALRWMVGVKTAAGVKRRYRT